MVEAAKNIVSFIVVGYLGVVRMMWLTESFSSRYVIVSLQLKILHTRVFGQFAVICTLLGVMGLKEMMDRQGKFVTEAEVEDRVVQMESTRNELLDRLDFQARQQQQPMRKLER